MHMSYQLYGSTITVGAIVSYIFIYVIQRVEARVFCQDSNARSWVPLGATCPVVCASVMTAIDKLILLDYKKSIKEQLGGRQALNKELIAYDNKDYVRMNYATRKKISPQDEYDKSIADSDENLNTEVDGDDKEPKINTENNGNNNNCGSTKDGLTQINDNFSNLKKSLNISKCDEYKSNGVTESDVKKNLKTLQINEQVSMEGLENFDESFKKSTDNKEPLEGNNKQIKNKKGVLYDLKILENLKNVQGIFRRAGNIISNYTKNYLNKDTEENQYNMDKRKPIEDKRCWFLEKFKPKLLIGKVVRKKCSRRSNFDAKFVSVMTDVLNKYVDSEFRFTDEMTEILLENIFGKNTDLRNNIFDVNRLLMYLRKSVHRHRVHSHRHVITLKSRHCLTVAMPGCFCRPGFVESSGQCVKPEDCITDEYYLQYLKRIVVL